MRRSETIRRVFWRSSKPRGWEVCFVRRAVGGWNLGGSLVRESEEGEVCATYEVRADSMWRTTSFEVRQLVEGQVMEVRMLAEGGSWYRDGKEKEVEGLRGCQDVDFEASPATNTLPIRRTRVRAGSTTRVRAAWVRFPSLDLLPLEQSYEKMGTNRFKYRSASGFEADLLTDDFGLVVKYGPWSLA